MMVTTTEALLKQLPTTLQTVDEFEQWQRQPGNDGSYEFVRGEIIPRSMKQYGVILTNFLMRQFMQTNSFRQGDILMAESDSYVDGVRKRIPDLTYFSSEQLTAIRRGKRVSTRFAIEILSESESFQDVSDKVQDHFDGGAGLVWYIEPLNQRIHVYTSPDKSKAYRGSAMLSAAPVVPDFQFAVSDLFA